MHEQNFDKFTELRQKYQTFSFDKIDIQKKDSELYVEFTFSIDKAFEFHPTFTFPYKEFYRYETLNDTDLQSLAFHIGMVELISYWKTICPKNVIIKPFKLLPEHIIFWKKIYYHGLGEFFYTNGIEVSQDEFMNLTSESANSLHLIQFDAPLSLESGTIIPVGGGKDSVVSLELLSGNKSNNLALIMNPRGASLATAKIAGYENRLIEIRRTIDKKLLELNAQGFLNGHTPFSALLGFMTVLAAKLSGKRYIALSNESSANEPTIAGTHINHQYSKSFEFETDFREYVHKFISPNIEYFSLLRPLSELQIASLFAKNQQYFADFKSCNAGSKEDIWCGKCSKCLFAFIILSPFIKPEVLTQIFGKNMLEDISMKKYFDELTGIADEKPFECVGTVDEVNEALQRSVTHYSESQLPELLKYYLKTEHPVFHSDLRKLEKQHFVKPEFLTLITKSLQES